LLLLGVTDQPNNFVYTPRPSLPAVVPLILPGTWLLVIGALNLFYGISVIAGSHIFITAAAWLTDDAQTWGGLMVVVGLIQMASAPAVFLFRGWAIAIGVFSVLLHIVVAILFVDNSEGIAIALLVLDPRRAGQLHRRYRGIADAGGGYVNLNWAPAAAAA
jgi:hypothetical protein